MGRGVSAAAGFLERLLAGGALTAAGSARLLATSDRSLELLEQSGDGVRDLSGEGVRDLSGDGVRDLSGDGVRDLSGEGLRPLSGEGLRAGCDGVGRERFPLPVPFGVRTLGFPVMKRRKVYGN